VDMPDRRRGQRLAHVRWALDDRATHHSAVMRRMPTSWSATSCPAVLDDPALVWLVGPVVDGWTAVAPHTAPA
jgi:hypothetical protein